MHDILRANRHHNRFGASDKNYYYLRIHADKACRPIFRGDADTTDAEPPRVRVVNMVFLLHWKAYAYTNRTTRNEKAEDAEDIKFILTCLVRKHQRASREQRAWVVPDRFWTKFACDYPDQEANLHAVGLLRGQAPSTIAKPVMQ